MMQSVMVYKGLDIKVDSKLFQIDPDNTAAQVRKQLTDAGFISIDDGENMWRFFVYSTEDTTNFNDSILGLVGEKDALIKRMFGPGDQLYLTNTAAPKTTDLMGIGTDWFFDRHAGCQVLLNTQEESARAANSGKFQPRMLTKVRPTAGAGSYDNVVVCQKDSVIGFNVNSWGAAGFGFDIKPDAGEPIVSALYVTLDDRPDTNASTWLARYQDPASQIRVIANKKTSTTGGYEVAYQRVVVRTWRIASYIKNGRSYSSSTLRPPSPDERIASNAGGYGDLVNGVIVPTSTVTPGAPSPGGNSAQQFGGISDVKDDYHKSEWLGQILMYFFVFNTDEDAKKVITGINGPNPARWQ